jgi:alpha,alpha-trehalose phosphorylase
MRLYVDDEPLLLSAADLADYERRLDFHDGLLRRRLVWRTPSGKLVELVTRRMVSMTERHVATFTFEVTILNADAAVTVSSQVLNRQDGEDEYHVPDSALGEGFDPRRADSFERRVLEPSGDGVLANARMWLGYRVAQSGMTLAVAVDHVVRSSDPLSVAAGTETDAAKFTVTTTATRGTTLTIEKTVAFHTSRGVPVAELRDRCCRTLDRVGEAGSAALFVAQREWFDAFWDRADVEIGGQPRLQQAVRWNLFQLAQATARAECNGIPAKGLSGSGYSGHYFWDTEIYVAPFLTYTNPSAARAVLGFRHALLPAARRRAAELAQRGALFPWRTINGEEASAYYAAGTAGYHVNADISYALDQYVAATGDADFIVDRGLDILVETARAWADLGFWREESGSPVFHIHGVTGPDEYTTVVDDNLFTNVMAQHNLAVAVRHLQRVGAEQPAEYAAIVDRLNITPEEIEEWRIAAEGMAIPFDMARGIHPQDARFLEREIWDLASTPASQRPLLLHFHPLVIYRFQVLKQADVVLAMFLRGDAFSLEEKRANFDYYDPLTTRDSTLSAAAQSIVASEVGYAELALRYFHESVFVDLTDSHGNTTQGLHIASTGGVWCTLVNGFGGFRDRAGLFTLDPHLPREWNHLRFRLTIAGRPFTVTITADEVTITGDEHQTEPQQFRVRDREYHVLPGRTLVVALEPGRQLTAM